MTEDRTPRLTRLAQEFIGYCDLVERELRGRKAAMNGHLQRAAASLLANAGEGFNDPNRGDKRRFFRYSLRSAGECERLLHGLAHVGAISAERLKEGVRILRSIKMDLLRLIRWAS